VICTRDRPELLDRCLASVSRLEYPRPFEVIVVDNAPNMPAREICQRWTARYILEPTKGLSRARNCGARHASGDLVMYLDDDAVAEPQWLIGLAREFQDPRVAMVAGRVLPLSGNEEFAVILDCGVERCVVDRQSTAWFKRRALGGLVIGTNMAVRACVFANWPGFDPRLGPGAPLFTSDDDFAFLSLVDLGFKVVYTPAAVIRHPVPATLPELRAMYLRKRVEQGVYVAFLLAEGRHRRDLIDYFLSRLAGHRGAKYSEACTLVSPKHQIGAMLKGMALFARWKLTGKPVTSSRSLSV